MLFIASFCVVLLGILATCCIAAFLMMIPFVGAIVLLPVTVFKRSYSLYYLAQYGQELDVFFLAAQPPPLGRPLDI